MVLYNIREIMNAVVSVGILYYVNVNVLSISFYAFIFNIKYITENAEYYYKLYQLLQI